MSNVTISAGNNVTFDRNYTGAVASGDVNSLYVQKCDNIIIKNIYFTQTDTCTGEIIRIVGSNNIIIRDCTFDTIRGGIYTRGYPDDTTKCTHISILKNEILNYTYCGICICDGSEYITIDENKIHDGNTTGDLLYAIASSNQGAVVRSMPYYNHITIKNNFIYNHTKHNAVDLHGGNYIKVLNNRILDCALGCAINVHNNSHDLSVPLTAEESINTTWDVSENTILNCNTGIIIKSDYTGATTKNVLVSKNEIDTILDTGIIIQASDNSIVKSVNIDNNIITNLLGSNANKIGIYINANPMDIETIDFNLHNITDVIISNNNIDGTNTDTDSYAGIRVDVGSVVKVSNNIIRKFDYGIYTTSGISSNENNIDINTNNIFECAQGIRNAELTRLSVNYPHRYINNNTLNGCGDGIKLALIETQTDIDISGNTFKNCTHPVTITSTNGSYPTISNNPGYPTESSGVATILASGTSITVDHGLVAVPSKIIVTPRGNIGNCWIDPDTITSTQFTIWCSSAPIDDTIVTWSAEV